MADQTEVERLAQELIEQMRTCFGGRNLPHSTVQAAFRRAYEAGARGMQERAAKVVAPLDVHSHQLCYDFCYECDLAAAVRSLPLTEDGK